MIQRPDENDMSSLFAEKGRISSYSVPDNCVELAPLPDGDSIAIQNHNRPEQGWLVFPRTAIDAFLLGAKAGEYDDFVAADTPKSAR